MHAILPYKFSESEQLASMEIHIQKGSDNITALETENTLSNVTSIQSQLQSLYDCNESIKLCDKYNNYKNINQNNSTDKLVYMHASNINETTNTHLVCNKSLGSSSGAVDSLTNQQRALDMLHQKQQNPDTKKNNTTQSDFKKNLSPQMMTKQYMKDSTVERSDGNKLPSLTTGTAASIGLNNTKTATILVSKTKTKTGLPLLLKNSIN